MKRSLLFFILICNITSIFCQNSHIQITAEPDISIFIDGNYKGKTISEMGGLIIENVAPGNHIIKVVKEGYNPQEEQINIKKGEVYMYTVNPSFVPKIKITQQGNVGEQRIEKKLGKIKVQSLPIAITIAIPQLGIKYSKTQDEWIADDIPEGSYDASFIWNNKTLTYTIKVNNNQLTHLFVNMIKGEFEDRSSVTKIETTTEKTKEEEKASKENERSGSFRDYRDGKSYKTIWIGNQLWMAENMNYRTPEDSWCYDNLESNCDKYGRLYSWFGAQNACPPGWHIPGSKEWMILVNYLGGTSIAGGKLKESGTSDWLSPNFGATNESGFSALPGGYLFIARGSNALLHGKEQFKGMNKLGVWWTSDVRAITSIYKEYYCFFLYNSNSQATIERFALVNSVRCIKDH